MAGIVLEDNWHLLPRMLVSVLRQPLLRGGRSPRITRFASNWQTDRTHQEVLQARRWAEPGKTSAGTTKTRDRSNIGNPACCGTRLLTARHKRDSQRNIARAKATMRQRIIPSQARQLC